MTWRPNEPDEYKIENCVAINEIQNGRGWFDLDCHREGHFVCEKPA